MIKLLLFIFSVNYCLIYTKCQDSNTTIMVRHSSEPIRESEIGFVMPSERQGGIVLYRLYTIYRILQFLILRSSHDPTVWNPSKGHIRVTKQENELEAGIRELREETGIPRTELKFVPAFHIVAQYAISGVRRRNTFFLAELVNPSTDLLLSEEHLDYKWVTYKEALHYSKTNFQKQIFTACYEKLNDLKIVQDPLLAQQQEQGY